MPTDSSETKPRVVDRIFGPSPREQQLDLEVRAIEQVLAGISNKMENAEIDGGYSVHEALKNIDLMIDSQGWTNVYDYDDKAGLTLRQVKEASEQIRELLVGNPFIQNGARIRSAHVWGGGVEFSSRNLNPDRDGNYKVSGMPRDISALIDSPWAQRYIFGNKAHSELEREAFSDGVLFWLGNDRTKQVQRIQIHEITGMLHNPNNSEEVWAYRRTWSRRPFDAEPDKRDTVTRWYYTDIFPGTRRARIMGPGGVVERAEVDYTLMDLHFNRQVGWALGVPDALCVVAWARLYKEFMVNGYVMSRSLARLAYKVTVGSTQAGQNAATSIIRPGQAGATEIVGQGNDFQALSTAGKGYDFSSGNSLASAMAAGLGVSLLALLSNPSAATGSNAAAQTLDPIAKATAQVRRNEWEDEFLRLFRFMGFTKTLVMTWHDLSEDGFNRIMQGLTLVNGSGLFAADVMQGAFAKAANIARPGPVPEGYLQPNNRASLPRKDIDTEGTGAPTASTGSGQGQDDGSGPTQDDHDDDES